MTSLEMSRRLEQHEIRRHQLTISGIVAGFVVVLAIGFGAGVWYAGPHEPQEPSQTAQAIEDLTDSLEVLRAMADSVHRADSVAMAAVLAQRPKTRVAMAPISVRDSVVIVERERPATDSTPPAIVADTFASPALAEGLRQMKIELELTTAALEASRADVVLLRHQENLLEQRDTLRVEREGELVTERTAAWREGFKAGAKAVAIGTAAIGGAVTLIKAFTGG